MTSTAPVYAAPVLYSAASHLLLLVDLARGADDRSAPTRAAVLLLELDHAAILLAFLYWVHAEAGARATPTRRLAHLSVERDATPGSAAVCLTTWPGGATRLLARADFHGSWVDWRTP